MVGFIAGVFVGAVVWDRFGTKIKEWVAAKLRR